MTSSDETDAGPAHESHEIEPGTHQDPGAETGPDGGHDRRPPGSPNFAGDSGPDIGECLQRGWSLYKREPLMLSAATLVVAVLNVIAGSIPFLGLLVAPPLLAGLYLMIIRLYRNETTVIGDLFDGFKYFLPLVVAGILVGVFVTIGVFVFVLPGLYLAVAYSFTTLNIVTRDMDFWPAMESSRKTINNCFWSYLGLALVVILILFAGSIPFGLGLLIAVPVCLAAQLHFYESIRKLH